MLEGLLSRDASALYDALVRHGSLPADDPRSTSAEMVELVDRGFARRSYGDETAIVPVEPSRAIDNAILSAQQRIAEQQRQIVAAREHLDVLQSAYRTSADVEGRDVIEVIRDPAKIGALSFELCLSAKTEFVSFTTASFRKAPTKQSAVATPREIVERGVRLRIVYERPALEIAGAKDAVAASLASGWEIRVVPSLPMKMVIADDHSALVPLDRTGMGGAALVRAQPVVAALRALFEMTWGSAVELGTSAAGSGHGTAALGAGLTPAQFKVLELVATGMTDGSIARHLDISERTVRRHVSAILMALGVDNRVAAVHAATRRGLLA